MDQSLQIISTLSLQFSKINKHTRRLIVSRINTNYARDFYSIEQSCLRISLSVVIHFKPKTKTISNTHFTNLTCFHLLKVCFHLLKVWLKSRRGVAHFTFTYHIINFYIVIILIPYRRLRSKALKSFGSMVRCTSPRSITSCPNLSPEQDSIRDV